MSNNGHQYFCINTSKTETCYKTPITIAGTDVFINVNANLRNTVRELLTIQKELYMEAIGDHVRYVDRKLVQRYNSRKSKPSGESFAQVRGALSQNEIEKKLKSLINSFSARFQRLTGIGEDIKTEFQYVQALSKEVKRRIKEGQMKLQGDIPLLRIYHEIDMTCNFSKDPKRSYHTVYLSPAGTINHCLRIESCGFRGGILNNSDGVYDEFSHKMFSHMETSIAFEPPKQCSTIVIENLEKTVEKLLAGKLRV